MTRVDLSVLTHGVNLIKSVSKVLGQMWALLALGWVSQDF